VRDKPVSDFADVLEPGAIIVSHDQRIKRVPETCQRSTASAAISRMPNASIRPYFSFEDIAAQTVKQTIR